jgi:hypothetical protein
MEQGTEAWKQEDIQQDLQEGSHAEDNEMKS